MYKDRKVLALIPARAGSKELPGKNIKPMLGKPLIAWTIEQAKKSRYVDRVVVSTESKEIAEIAAEHGGEVPFLRPRELAADASKVIEAVRHALRRLKENKDDHDAVLLLQPTSPLRDPEDIDKAIELLFSNDAKAVISVSKAAHHPYWANTLPANRSMKNFIRQAAVNKNRQEISDFYVLNGAIFAAFCGYLLEGNNFQGENTFAYVMPKKRSIDIDDEVDFAVAEFLLDKATKRKAADEK